MSHQELVIKSLMLLQAIVGSTLLLAPAVAQQSDGWQLPRTGDGQPDLQGVWANNTITPVERPASYRDQEFLAIVIESCHDRLFQYRIITS